LARPVCSRMTSSRSRFHISSEEKVYGSRTKRQRMNQNKKCQNFVKYFVVVDRAREFSFFFQIKYASLSLRLFVDFCCFRPFFIHFLFISDETPAGGTSFDFRDKSVHRCACSPCAFSYEFDYRWHADKGGDIISFVLY